MPIILQAYNPYKQYNQKPNNANNQNNPYNPYTFMIFLPQISLFAVLSDDEEVLQDNLSLSFLPDDPGIQKPPAPPSSRQRAVANYWRRQF